MLHTLLKISSCCSAMDLVIISQGFLKMHKQNVHGVIGGLKPTAIAKPSQEMAQEPLATSSPKGSLPSPEGPPPNVTVTPNGLPEPVKSAEGKGSDELNRYYSHYTEVCPHCDRRFKLVKWLQSHIAIEHGSQTQGLSSGMSI